MKEELRVFTDKVEFREAKDGKAAMLSCLAIPYNKRSSPIGGSFYEVVKPGAAKNLFEPDSDVHALVGHDFTRVLGRTKANTLRFMDSPEGVRAEIDLPDTQLAKDTAESVKRGDITGMSFRFRTRTDKWDNMSDGLPLRELHHIDVREVSVVANPAYPDSSVEARADEGTKEVISHAKSLALAHGQVPEWQMQHNLSRLRLAEKE